MPNPFELLGKTNSLWISIWVFDTSLTNEWAHIHSCRSNSSASNRGKRKKIQSSKSASNIVQLGQGGPPTTPEPDYSCTDSEGESDVEPRDITGLANRLSSVQLQPVENSGNSNTR